MARWLRVSAYNGNALSLPAIDPEATAAWHARCFGMTRVAHTSDTPTTAVVVARTPHATHTRASSDDNADGTGTVQLGFAATGEDPENDGAAIRVDNAAAARAEIEAAGVETSNWRIDVHNGREQQVFFAKEPGGLCYYFYQPLKLLRGLSAFPVTPQSAAGVVDTEALARLVTTIATTPGVESIGLLGSTGTYAYLSREERHRAVKAAAKALDAATVPYAATTSADADASSKPRVRPIKLVVGVGHIRTDTTIEMARDALAAGADAGLLAPVSYTPLTDEEVYQHFASVTRAVPDLPLIIYDNPSTTKFSFSDNLVGRIAASMPTVVGLKRCAGDEGTDHASAHAALAAAVGPRVLDDFSLGYARDNCIVDAMLAGGECWYSVLGGLFPEACVAMCAASLRKDADSVRRLAARLSPLWPVWNEHGSLRVAYCIAQLTHMCHHNPPRPLLPLGGDDRARIAKALTDSGLVTAVASEPSAES
eukprot:m.177150 g.177150  ORF g.177150 m.177150 type:complete len:481 (+) comp14298_c0_seq1:52-1494(+)